MPDSTDARASKRLSYVLRHAPHSVGLTLDPHGWVAVTDLLDALAAHGLTLTGLDVARLVAESDKQRFELDETTDRIRARQGHSVPVDLDLPPATPPATLFHGTPARNVPSILTSGLHRGTRHHVHLSPDITTATAVGARRGDPVILVIDAAGMSAAGHLFYVTSNGVWLTEHVPPRFITTR